ncbi:MAG: hypothetical protein KatS3mg115_1609 [Candidatus Poribacteria bacterium]|nr:MAG: hypothetical protein KatS3mg115_1609 [Candidatus Poribacteria bacterium]
MDRRTLLFIVLSTLIFLIWAWMQRPTMTVPPPEGVGAEATQAPQEEPAPTEMGTEVSEAPTVTEEPSGLEEGVPAVSSPVAWAERVRRSKATTVRSPVYEIEVVHATASLRAWRLLQYPARRPNGQLSEEPADLIALYGPDYAGVRIDGRSLSWEPVGEVPQEVRLSEANPEATLQFRARDGDLEIIKTFRFHYSDAQAVRRGA